MSKVNRLVEGNWYVIKNSAAFIVSAQRCIDGKLGGMATIEVMEEMGGTVHEGVLMTVEEWEAQRKVAWEEGYGNMDLGTSFSDKDGDS